MRLEPGALPLRYVVACATGGYHLRVAKKVGAVQVPAVNRYGRPVRHFDWLTGEVGEDQVIPYRCKSRRHPGPCRDYAGRVLFTRVKDALERQPKDSLVLMVLTLNRKDFREPMDAFDGLRIRWRLLAQSMQRRWGEVVPILDEHGEQKFSKRRREVGFELEWNEDGTPKMWRHGKHKGTQKVRRIMAHVPLTKRARVEHLTTVEIHPSSGCPHLNVVISNRQLWEELGPHVKEQRETASGRVEWRRLPVTAKGRRTMRELKSMAVRAGFGFMLTASRVDNLEAVAGYVTKVSNRVHDNGLPVVGEVTKGTQVPVNAPPHFRCVRSTPGFMDPLWAESEYTGELKFTPAPKSATDAWVARQQDRKRRNGPT